MQRRLKALLASIKRALDVTVGELLPRVVTSDLKAGRTFPSLAGEAPPKGIPCSSPRTSSLETKD
jgi:hypothetical protein